MRVDPADGSVQAPYQPSAPLRMSVRTCTDLAASGDAGRLGRGAPPWLALVLTSSGLVPLLRRITPGSACWTPDKPAHARHAGAARNVLTGRVVLAVLLLTSATALAMSATTLGFVAPRPLDRARVALLDQRPAGAGRFASCHGCNLPLRDLRKLSSRCRRS